MTIDRLQKLLVYLLNLLGFASIATSGELGLIPTILFLAAVGISWFWEAPRVRYERWAPAWTVVTIAFFAFSIIDVMVLDEQLLRGAMNFVLFLAASKLFQRAELKDYTQSMALSLLLLAAGSVLNSELSFGVVFGLYVLTATIGLTVHHLNREVTEHSARRAHTIRMERAVVWATTVLAALVFAGSVAFFFAVPRVGFGFFMSQSRFGLFTAGFSDDVELGQHGTIRDDPSIVMRVKFEGQPPMPPETIHWRGLSLDFYDGRSWHDRVERSVRVVRYDEGYDVRPGRRGGTWRDAIEDTVRTEVYLEPIGSDVLFSIGRMSAVTFTRTASDLPDSFFGRHLDADTTGEIRFSRRGELGVSYVAYSRPNDPPIERIRRAEWPLDSADLGAAVRRLYETVVEARGDKVPDDPHYPLTDEVIREARRAAEADSFGRMFWAADTYLQLPEGIVTPRMAEMTARLRADNPNAYDYAKAVERTLREEIAYTTDLPAPESAETNVVDAFLFDWQRGHCEYFATAMVMMLREQGIPARLVNGYLGADYNSVGNYYAVRQGNAHTWVEAFFPGAGWIELDPTPSSPESFQQKNAWVQRLLETLDSARLWWFRWVVEYNLEKQVSLLQDAANQLRGDGGDGPQERIDVFEKLYDLAWGLFRNLGAILLTIVLAIVFGVVYRRRFRRQIPWDANDTIYALLWWGASIASVVYLWQRGRVPWGILFCLSPPTIGVISAWLYRRAFVHETGPSRSARGRHEMSALYARLLREIESRGVELPFGVTAAELHASLPPLPPEIARELQAFLAEYTRVRFGGVTLSDDALRAWKKRFRSLRRELRNVLKQAAKGD